MTTLMHPKPQLSKANNYIESWLDSQKNKTLLRFLTCGSVDDGKSTLIGRLLHDTNQIYEDQLMILQIDSNRQKTNREKIEWSLLVDGLQAELEQGITIDVAYRYFSTTKRKFIIADTPGHEQYTRNMVTGASTCDLAILLIDSCKGMLKQTRRHSFISTLLGIKYLVVAINKMDLVQYSQKIFEKIKQDYLHFAKNLPKNIDISFIPISALEGDNIVQRTSNMQWYNGSTLLHVLENITIKKKINYQPMCFPVQYINHHHDHFRGYSGTLSSGVMKVGQLVKVLPINIESQITRIVTFDGDLQEALPGQAITLMLRDEIDISRGDFIVAREAKLKTGQYAKIYVVWMSTNPLKSSQIYNAKMGAKNTRVYIEKIHYQFEIDTMKKIPVDSLQLNGIGLISVEFTEPVILEKYQNNPIISNMIFIDRFTNLTLGAGMINEPLDSSRNLNKYDSFKKELNDLINHYFP